MQKFVKIEGIHCDECKKRITNSLLKNNNISKVKIKNGIATIECTEKLKNKDIIKIIHRLGYFTKEEYIKEEETHSKIKLYEFSIIVLGIIFINFILYKIFGYNIFNIIPSIDKNITYGMLFITGILTSIHCISMCGAINLLAIYHDKNNIKKPIFYNLGRILSYSCLGGFVGILGGIIQVNSRVSGIIVIVTSIIMFFLALKMLGLIDFQFICLKSKKIKTNSSFLIGVLNGFMPCGPLQAMQVYALSTGSFWKGALSMFLFCLGTVPLMLSIGMLFHLLQGRWKLLINKVASVLILILSLVMLNRGLLFLNIDLFQNKDYDNYLVSNIEDGIQVVEFDLSYNNYQDIIVQSGVPLKIIIHVDSKKLTGCNNEIIMQDFDIEKKLEVGDNIIEFIPTEEGIYTYTCWMNMIKNNIKVVEDIEKYQK